MTVWEFSRGLIVRVAQTFTDYTGQEVRAGEVLLFVERHYLPYESGHTIRFADRTIYLCDDVEANKLVVDNENNAYFQPLN